jgi:hypothetical protein
MILTTKPLQNHINKKEKNKLCYVWHGIVWEIQISIF